MLSDDLRLPSTIKIIDAPNQIHTLKNMDQRKKLKNLIEDHSYI